MKYDVSSNWAEASYQQLLWKINTIKANLINGFTNAASFIFL